MRIQAMPLFLLLLLLTALAMAQTSKPVFTESPKQPLSVITEYGGMILGIAILMMIAMVVMAAAIYAVGQLFGTETRAKASVYAQGMLVAVGISLAVVVVLFYIGGERILAGEQPVYGVEQIIGKLRDLARDFLIGLIIIMVVLAAAVYAIGQVFGAETRARAANWANTLLTGAILAAILYVVVFYVVEGLRAASFFVGEGSPVAQEVANAIFTVVMLVAMVVLITYLISRFFKVPEWEAYLNVEMANLLSTFFIVAFVLGLFGVSKAIAVEMSHGAFDSPPKAAIAFMQDTVADSAVKAAIDVYKINACTSILSTFSRRIGEFVLTQTYKVFPGLDTFVSITNAIAFPIVTVYNTIMVQVTFLYFIDVVMFKFFLPAGIALRFFPPTRDAGAFLISLAIGLYIIFPMTYMINEQVFWDINAKPYCSTTVRDAPCPTVLINYFCGPFKYGFWGYLLNTKAFPLFQVLPGGATALGDLLAKFISEGLLNLTSMPEFIPILRYVAELSLIGLFMPALSMMITISFINAMTKFIVAKV